MEQPLVSVIMPTFNDRPEFLNESIPSILNQTYSNIELVIADDSTSEETKAIIDKYAVSDNRITVIRKAERMGVCGALNEAIKHSKGEFIAHMDADDISQLRRIELQIQKYIETGTPIIGGQMDIISENGKVLYQAPVMPESHADFKKGLQSGDALIYNPTSMVKTCLLKECGCYDPLYKCSEDYDLWYKIGGDNEVVNIAEILVHYRIHGNNAHIKMSDTQAVLCSMSRLKYNLGLNRNLNEKEFRYLSDYVCNNFLLKFEIHLSKADNYLYKLLATTGIKKPVIRMTNYLQNRKRKAILKEIEELR